MVRSSASVCWAAMTTYWYTQPDAGGVRPQGRGDAARHAPRCKIKVFQYPCSRPVDVGVVLENDVDKGCAEHRQAPHHPGFRHRQHGCAQGIGDLVFHHLRRLARVFRVDDDLHIREIRNRVQGHADHGSRCPSRSRTRFPATPGTRCVRTIR